MILACLFATLATTAGAVSADIGSLGAAGVMGAMWYWERRTSRQREEQLDAAHREILNGRVQIQSLLSALDRNTEALTRLATLQSQLLEHLHEQNA